MGSVVEKGTDIDCYSVCCEGLGRQLREELILNVTVLVVRVLGGNIERNYY
jgi:hypothetical protein